MADTLIDRLMSRVAPQRHAQRTATRAQLEASAARARAETSYFRNTAIPILERNGRAAEISEFLNSYSGGVPTRLDRSWATGGVSMFGLRTDQRQRVRSMRDRARQLDNENALASAVLDRATENVIGVGIRMKARTDNEEFNEQVDALWKKWWRNCDLRGLLGFGAMQQLVYRQHLLDGDVGIILVDRGGEPRLQIVEAQNIVTPDGQQGNGNILDGVELNDIGRPSRFWISSEREMGRREFFPVEARDFIFLPRIRRPYQLRGLTAFAQAFQLFDNIMGYMEATVVAARVGASQALFIKREGGGTATMASLPLATNSQGQSQALQTIEPGMVHYLRPDEGVEGFNPTQPTQSFPEAIAAMARFVGLNFGITLEQVMLDFSRTTYTSGRAARLQAEQTAYTEQENFYHTVLERIWRWLVSRWVASEEITAKVPEEYWPHEWIPQGKPWVDPTKEIDAAIREVKELRTNTRSNIATSNGYDFKDLCEENKTDEALLKANGLLDEPDEGQNKFDEKRRRQEEV